MCRLSQLEKTGQTVKPVLPRSHIICFVLVFPEKSTSAGDIPCPKTTGAVSSTEFTCCLLDERDNWIRLGGGSGHDAMIPSL